MEIKLAVGIWSFTPGGGRFHDRYVADATVEQRIEMASEMAKFGISGIEAHYDTEVDEENLHLYKRLERESGIRLISFGPQLFFERDYEFGTFSNPISKHRDSATRRFVRILEFARESGVDAVGLWPGIDGYTYSYGHLYYQMWDYFESALAEAMDEVPGVMVRLESKPYEPIPNSIYRTIGDGLLMARDIEARLKNPINRDLLDKGFVLVGMQPEIGHIRMGYEDTPYAFARILREGRMSHPHFNSQPLGNYDQDLNVGVVEWDQAEAGLLQLKMAGFKEYIGIDINPERMPILKAVEVNARVMEIMNERINSLPVERLVESYYSPDTNRGEIELILAESRRP
jgi:xylose isomerase